MFISKLNPLKIKPEISDLIIINEIALKCREPSPAHMQISMCAYLISMCGITALEGCAILSKMAEYSSDATFHIAL